MKKPKRSPAGRKPVADKKEALTIYVQRSVIERNGGKDKCRELMIKALEG